MPGFNFPFQMQNIAPAGSERIAIRPSSMTSNGPPFTPPPSAPALAAVASASAEAMYSIQ